MCLCLFPDYELIVDSDILPNRVNVGTTWSSSCFECQEPAQFEERHLIFLQQLGRVCANYNTFSSWKDIPEVYNRVHQRF